jgi:hypothetical protein
MTEPQPGRAARLDLAMLRDGTTCVWCGREFTGHVVPTTDHLVPRAKGGPSWLENEVAACRRCNRARGHVSPAQWLAECEVRGWEPDVDRVRRVLHLLQEAITERGGQRRARPYIDSQLRRLLKSVE